MGADRTASPARHLSGRRVNADLAAVVPQRPTERRPAVWVLSGSAEPARGARAGRNWQTRRPRHLRRLFSWLARGSRTRCRRSTRPGRITETAVAKRVALGVPTVAATLEATSIARRASSQKGAGALGSTPSSSATRWTRVKRLFTSAGPPTPAPAGAPLEARQRRDVPSAGGLGPARCSARGQRCAREASPDRSSCGPPFHTPLLQQPRLCEDGRRPTAVSSATSRSHRVQRKATT